jgi:hypothetical protein
VGPSTITVTITSGAAATARPSTGGIIEVAGGEAPTFTRLRCPSSLGTRTTMTT